MPLGFAGHHDDDDDDVGHGTDVNYKLRHEKLSMGYARIQDVNQRLRDENQRLKDENDTLRSEVDRLEKESLHYVELAREARDKTRRLQDNTRQMQKAAKRRKHALKVMREKLGAAELELDLMVRHERLAVSFRSRKGQLPFIEAKRDFERRYCMSCLRITAGNISAAARMAGKDRADFYTLLKRTGVDAEKFRP